MQKENKSLDISRRLSGYSALAGAFILAGGQVNADVVYTDLGSGVLIDGSAFDIDFDGDGIVDATVSQTGLYGSSYTTSYGYTYTYPGIEIVAFNAGNNNFVGYGGSYPGSYVYASALAASVLVGGGGTAAPNVNVVAAAPPFSFRYNEL